MHWFLGSLLLNTEFWNGLLWPFLVVLFPITFILLSFLYNHHLLQLVRSFFLSELFSFGSQPC